MKQCVKVIKNDDPDTFVLENVKNFASKKHAKARIKLMKKLKKSGKYRVKTKILCPKVLKKNIQSRGQWFCVGLKKART